jgi:hypothetical protein
VSTYTQTTSVRALKMFASHIVVARLASVVQLKGTCVLLVQNDHV